MITKVISVNNGRIIIKECNGDHVIVAKYFYIGSLEP